MADKLNIIELQNLELKLGYSFQNIKLLDQALTHRSYGAVHNERLEYLGDAVLDLVVADYLYSNFKDREGEMTKVRASYVCENANYAYAESLGLYEYIKVGHGEEKSGVKKAILADIFEALLGAIYIDLGYATARRVILRIIVPFINNPNITFFSDYKSALPYLKQLKNMFPRKDDYRNAYINCLGSAIAKYTNPAYIVIAILFLLKIGESYLLGTKFIPGWLVDVGWIIWIIMLIVQFGLPWMMKRFMK